MNSAINKEIIAEKPLTACGEKKSLLYQGACCLQCWKWYGQLSLVVALILAMPIFTVILSLFIPDEGTLSHLFDNVLWKYISNAAILLISVCTMTFIIGVGAAWLVTMYEFPLSKKLRWAMIFPLAMPAYVLAMIYGYLLEPAGPVQAWINDYLSISYRELPLPDIRSLAGASIMLSLALYPYVYILARNAFAQHSCQLLDSAKMLGINGTKLLTHVALPAARPAIVVALSLVGMETLADFGTVSIYGVESFTTGIYRIWFGAGDLVGAAKLSAMLLLLVGGVLWLERKSRKDARYHNTTALYHPLPLKKISGMKAAAATIFCSIPLIVGFIIPIAVLIGWHTDNSPTILSIDKHTLKAAANALIIGICVVIVALAIALLFSLTIRCNSLTNNKNHPSNSIKGKASRFLLASIRFASLGYAIPGSVVAVGILIPMLWLDKTIADAIYSWFNLDIGLLITGSIAAVVLACTVRFMAIALGSVESSLQSISNVMDDAACVLGHCKKAITCKIHLPMIKGGLAMAAIMLFVDTVKELPATIMMRPFNFDTLAIRTYELAMDEQFLDAASPALLMIIVSLIPVTILAIKIGCKRPGATNNN